VDCTCWGSSFIFPDESIQEIIGHRIVGIDNTVLDENSVDGDEHGKELIFIKLDNGKVIEGCRQPVWNPPYYGSWVDKSWNTVVPSDQTFPLSARITFVVGLPCSGKTTFARNHFNSSNDEIYDDVLTNLSCSSLRERLQAGKHLVLTDPRFCDIKQFQGFMKLLFPLFDHENKRRDTPVPMTTILLHSDADTCIANWKADQTLMRVKPGLEATIRVLANSGISMENYPNVYVKIGYRSL
jgi:hypothetical protein